LSTNETQGTAAPAGDLREEVRLFADTAVFSDTGGAEEVVSDRPDAVASLQVSQTVRSIPLLLFFHASAAISLSNLPAFQHAPRTLQFWQASAALVGLLFAAVFFAWRRGRWREAPARVLHALEFAGLLLGLVWVIPIATLAQTHVSAHVIPVAGITLAMLSIGVVSMIRAPTGAVVFNGLLSAALALSLYRSLESHQALASLLCAIYCLVLTGVTVTSHIDFRRRSKAELDVKHQNDIIKLLLNDFEREARDWLWETDREGRLTYVSPRLAEFTGKSASTLMGQPLRLVLAGFTSIADIQRLEDAMGGLDLISNLQVELKRDGKPVFWQLTAQPLRDEKGVATGYRGVCRDVTLAQEAQRGIEDAMRASERASAAKSQFLAVMSHELRTPINSIVGFTEMLAQDKTGSLDNLTRNEFSETVLESARHLQNLINDLLDATRMENGSFTLHEQDADAAELVEVAIKLCRESAARANVGIVGRLTDGITLAGDVTRLKQVIINLLTNAVKFSPPGSTVTVEMQRGRGGQFVLAIKDSGIGVAPEDIEKIFDPFIQVDVGLARRFGGVGLGLPIARRIARLHDGDVTLESVKGVGTTARLVLPPRRVVWPGEPVKHVA
jgi:PAS domain S-box-containing protein